MNSPGERRIIFITGTDTGVGKTVLTGLLLQHLRRTGCHALAMKPFCSGDREDARLLHSIQDGELTLEEVNPFFFEEPVAPLVSVRQHHLSIPLQEVLRRISHVATRCERLLIEGSGGLLVPLGEGYSVADLIAKLNCEVIVVSRNRLGTINHTMLTVRSLQHSGARALTVVLMGQSEPDPSAASNAPIMAELLGQVPLHTLGFLGDDASRVEALKRAEKIFEKTLALILANSHVE
jgi:dethiobiotin synthetase